MERKVSDLSYIYENFEMPDEFLRDPSYWMPVEQMESFLFIAKHYYQEECGEGDLIESVGSSTPTLRAWGALDSVLRMMDNPPDIFLQPDRFLSYFFSPMEPPEDIHHSSEGVSFTIPLDVEEYPLIGSYLKVAFEVLPGYIGKSAAVCQWQGRDFQLSWSNDQAQLFEDPSKRVSPDLLQSIIRTLQESQQALEVRNRELYEKNKELMTQGQSAQKEEGIEQEPPVQAHLKGAAELPPLVSGSISGRDERVLNANLQKMKDYFTRANQLITILVGQDRMSRQVREAMRRTDWERTTSEFPKVVEESLTLVRELSRSTENTGSPKAADDITGHKLQRGTE